MKSLESPVLDIVRKVAGRIDKINLVKLALRERLLAANRGGKPEAIPLSARRRRADCQQLDLAMRAATPI